MRESSRRRAIEIRVAIGRRARPAGSLISMLRNIRKGDCPLGSVWRLVSVAFEAQRSTRNLWLVEGRVVGDKIDEPCRHFRALRLLNKVTGRDSVVGQAFCPWDVLD